MKYLITVLVIITLGFPQEETSTTKTDKFKSRLSGLMRIEDYYLPDLIGLNDTLECNIRKTQISGDTKYYFQIVKKGKYDNKTATISETDLREIIEVIQVLNEKSNSERTLTKKERQKAIDRISKDSLDLSIPYLPYYLENKYMVEDGFQIGYGSQIGITWFVKLERYGSNNIVVFADYNYLKESFEQALQKIEELKAGIIGDVEKFLQWKTKIDSIELAKIKAYQAYYDSIMNSKKLDIALTDNKIKDGEQLKYYSDGTLKARIEWSNGQRHGEEREYYPDGTLKLITHWRYGKKDGKRTFYNNKGEELYTTYYRDGKKTMTIIEGKRVYHKE